MDVVAKIRLSAATMADVPALLKLVQGAYRGDDARRGWTHEADLLDGQRIDGDGLATILADDQARLMLAFDQDALTGCVQVSAAGQGRCFLSLLAVGPLRQAGGVGRALIQAAERAAADLFGATTMEMTVIRQRADLIAYYERRGYRPTGESRAFPYDDRGFGLPRVPDLEFVVLAKALNSGR